MAYYIAIFDWSLYSLPAALSTADIEGDTFGHGTPSWLGETFTFNGGTSTLLEINDDDTDFQDAYVETGGSQTLAQDVTINGVNFFAGDVVENEFSMLDASGNEIWVVRIDGVNVGFAYPSGVAPTVGQTFVGDVGRDGAAADSQDGVASSEPYDGVLCFTKGAQIDTPHGLRAVETLEIGDLVTTIDGGPQPIRWTSRRRVTFNDGLEDARPVEINAGAFAPDLPRSRLVVSPPHRFVFRRCDNAAHSDVFIAAKALTGLPGVRTMKGKKSVEYIHIALARHHVIIAEGVQTESCYLGPVMLNDVPRSMRPKLKELFPDITFDPGSGYGPTARPVLCVQPARAMLKAGQIVHSSASANAIVEDANPQRSNSGKALVR